MIFLALEFSSDQRSVALARHGEVLASATETGGFRVTNAFSLITRVLAQSGLTREQIGGIAVGLGPGSYTGIRSAIAIAQGWQLARPVKLLGISSVEAIAARAQADGVSGCFRLLVADAQRSGFLSSPPGNFPPPPARKFPLLQIVSAATLAGRQGRRNAVVLWPSACGKSSS